MNFFHAFALLLIYSIDRKIIILEEKKNNVDKY